MSHLNDLIRQLATKDPALARDIEKEVKALADRRAFGLNFERHTPEAVDLPGRRPVKGSKVRIQPPRGEMPKKENDRLWEIIAIDPVTNPPVASMNALDGSGDINRASVEDLVVVAEFSDPIYPGLVSTGKVERGGDKPYHSVINAENYHALQALLFTHRGKVDCIYIDPPYNTGAKDWKYNNDYVESDDLYRHSKWLAFMERRLLLAKELLNPDDSVLIVTIDEKEYLRLGLLLEQLFPEAQVQMVSSMINPKGVSRGQGFRRTDEYLFFVMIGSATPSRLELGAEWASHARGSAAQQARQSSAEGPGWSSMMRRGSNSARADRPLMFYPIYVDPTVPRVVEAGEPLASGVNEPPLRDGLIAVLPLRSNGDHGRWQVGAKEFNARVEQGRVKVGRPTAYGFVINYLSDGAYAEVMSERFEVHGRAEDGSLLASGRQDSRRVAPTQWKVPGHNASENGSGLINALLPRRSFPFPKSLYAVEDAVRFFTSGKPNATVIDFFSGSGTTAHALMRLNKQDGGRRRSISVTNNEVSADEQKALRQQGLRPGDKEWERHGICDYITKPRIAAAITGKTPDGEPIKGDYKFTDEFPMADGFEENVEFFTLTYESPLRVEANYAFGRIAPLLWIRAGSQGRRIDDLSAGWDVAETYGVISDLDHSEEFARAIAAAPAASVAFIITDEDRLFEALVRELPDHVEPVRLYEAYLRTFEIEARRAAER
ncbi:DNA methyltransferase [uncultured Microbacterium sp.]|uniref:site-specific DNA-methyltransferase n=1 Tax=uncultured Microbacterium sp. TaxID=191216 RepID=UPI0028EC104A|nr:DNA methyltransferase [uncultured Microbacterium sp.]